MTSPITGADEILKKLENLGTKSAKKIARSAINKGLRIVTKSMKTEVPAQYKDAKRAIGSRFDKKGGENKDEVRAKAGVAVGFGRKKLSNMKKADRSGRPGVGIGVQNLMWFVLGTNERQTGSKKSGKGQKSTGKAVHSTGRMRPILPNVIKAGYRKAESSAMDAILNGLSEGITKEAGG